MFDHAHKKKMYADGTSNHALPYLTKKGVSGFRNQLSK